MAVMVAVPDSEEGAYALDAGVAEAAARGTNLFIVDLTLGGIDTSEVPKEVDIEVVQRRSKADRDPVDTVVHALAAHPDVERLVICVARRSPVGKFLLGSVSQRLILEAEVPVICVKRPK